MGKRYHRFQLPASSFQLPASSFPLPASRFALPLSVAPPVAARTADRAPREYPRIIGVV
jgi:hypothetical protein